MLGLLLNHVHPSQNFYHKNWRPQGGGTQFQALIWIHFLNSSAIQMVKMFSAFMKPEGSVQTYHSPKPLSEYILRHPIQSTP
jgi:hypothetical protein